MTTLSEPLIHARHASYHGSGLARLAVLTPGPRSPARGATRSGAGGYSGVFADPDGHPWEVAHNPYWQLGENGAVKLS